MEKLLMQHDMQKLKVFSKFEVTISRRSWYAGYTKVHREILESHNPSLLLTNIRENK